MGLSDFEILEKIGDGTYSTVYKVTRKRDNKLYALKKVKFFSLGEREQENALNEIRILASIRHPNVIAYKEAFMDEESNSLCIIMEYADGGDLFTLIQAHKKNSTRFKETEIWDMFSQALEGLKALHDLRILHRDLKSANFFLTKEKAVKIGDMNVSKVLRQGLLHTQTGTPYYASPEVWKDLPYGFKSDIWSLGCILYEMGALSPPFMAADMQVLYRKVIKGELPHLPYLYSHDLNELTRFMLKVNPALRPNCEIIFEHPIMIKRCIKGEMKNECHTLLKTIYVPKRLEAFGNVLPRPKYKEKLLKNGRKNSEFEYKTPLLPKLKNFKKSMDIRAEKQTQFLKLSKYRERYASLREKPVTIASRIQALKEHYSGKTNKYN